MFKITEHCLSLLSTLSTLKNPEEYLDAVMDLTNTLRLSLERCLKDKSLPEDSLLCYHQITTSLKFIAQPPEETVLNYFGTRIRFCLLELQKQGEPSDTPAVPESVLTTMDLVVDMLDQPGVDELPADDLTDAIDRLLSQVLLFRTVILPQDQKKVLEMCRCVLAKKLELRKIDSGDQSRPMKSLIVEDLKRSVAELEQLLNNCVLQLFVSVMVHLDDDPLADLASFPEADFDLLMDRLIQLGIIALGFTESGSVKLNLRSAVASLESLDLHLVPVLLKSKQSASDNVSGNTLRRTLLRHWRDETAKLSSNIHKIIDTRALSAFLIDITTDLLNRNEANAKEQQPHGLGIGCLGGLEGILKMCLVFHQHLCLNGIGGGDYIVGTRPAENVLLEHHRKDMKIMLNECKAVLKYADQVEAPRVFKRFRLLLHILEKIQQDLPSENDGDETSGQPVSATWKGSEIESHDEESVQHEHVSTLGRADYDEAEYFTSFGISMAATSGVFYQKQAKKSKFQSPLPPNQCSMIPQLSSALMYPPSHWKRRLPRTNRLFRADGTLNQSGNLPQHSAAKGDKKEKAEESMELNITEILEQLTKLSVTFAD